MKTELEHLKIIYQTEKQLIKEQIVSKVERMIKRIEFRQKAGFKSVGGMIEVGASHLIELDDLLAKLQSKENDIARIIEQINNH